MSLHITGIKGLWSGAVEVFTNLNFGVSLGTTYFKHSIMGELN